MNIYHVRWTAYGCEMNAVAVAPDERIAVAQVSPIDATSIATVLVGTATPGRYKEPALLACESL